MNRPKTRRLALGALLITAAAGSALFIAQRFPRKITVDYPLEGSVFPPEFPPPTFLFRDAGGKAAVWKIDVENFPAFILVDDKGNDFFANGCAACLPAKK